MWARLAPCEQAMMRLSGLRPRNQAGKTSDVIVLLPCRGGIEMIRRVISPRSTFSRASAMATWKSLATKFR